MVTGVPLAVTSANIALFSRTNENSLADSLVRLASGRKVNRPSDGIPEFFFSEKLKRNNSDDRYTLRSIQEAQAFIDVASSVGETVFNALTDMQSLVTQYYHADTNDDEKTAIAAEFSALKNAVSGIMQSSKYDGMTVMSDNGGAAFKQVVLDQKNLSLTFNIAYDDTEDIADVAALAVGASDEATELAAVEDELVKAGSYLAKTSAFERGLGAHFAIVSNRITTESVNAERAVESSTGEEYIAAMKKSIQNESSIAMLAQANMYRTSIVKLFL